MFDFATDQTFIRSLACAALHPGLRSILIFDAPPAGLQQVELLLARMLERVTGLAVEHNSLGAAEQDDDLWGSVSLPGMKEGALASRRISKLFSKERNAGKLQLITLPDLAKLSLAATRSCIMLLGTEVAHLERHTEHERWFPQQCWLASCSRSSVGTLSPHLLDRFALRLSWKQINLQNREQRIADLMANVEHEAKAVGVSSQFLQNLKRAARQQTDISQEALAQVLDYTSAEHSYQRREIALARLALTLARLENDKQMTQEHVDEAATMLGLVKNEMRAEQEDEEQSPIESPPLLDTGQQESATSSLAEATPQLMAEQETKTEMLVAQMPDTTATEPVAAPGLSNNPYPEDEQMIEREFASLRVPYPRFSSASSDRGPIFGTEPTDTLQDLAIVSTLLRAAMFQNVRLQPEQNGHLILKEDDLRRYRRGYVAEHMLLLLMDYTSLRECNWQDALLVYLSEAYKERASITVVKVGASDALNPLRAEMVSGRNILHPRIRMALEATRGSATPLAHGLDLAFQALQQALQHGRSAIQKVTFVVISDGRGNVPLAASHRGELHTIVRREGIEDALEVAQTIRTLKRVERIVLNPRPQYYARLPERLATALGAVIDDMPVEDVEVEP